MAFGIALLGFVALAGFSAKMLDGFEIRKRTKDVIYLVASLAFVAAGAIAAISISPEVVVSLLIALVLMGKIEKWGLRAAYSIVLILAAAVIRDISVMSPLSVAILALCAMVDETEIKIIRDYRPSMWIGSILIGLMAGGWAPLAAIAAFDIGYALASRAKAHVLGLLK